MPTPNAKAAAADATPFNRYIQGFLAISIVIGFFGTITMLMLLGELPSSVKDILLVMLGALLASYKELTSYFFGSSAGSADKAATLAIVATTPPPAPVVIAAPGAPPLLLPAPAPVPAAVLLPVPPPLPVPVPDPAVPVPVGADPVHVLSGPDRLPERSLAWPISWLGVALLASREKSMLTAYLDWPSRTPTIGFGQTDGVKLGMVWTEAQADADLLAGLIEYTEAVRAMCTVLPGENQLAALVVCAWNIGIAGLRGSSMIRLHNESNFIAAAAAFYQWNKAHDEAGRLIVVPELISRRMAEAALYLTPDPGAPTKPVPQRVAVPV